MNKLKWKLQKFLKGYSDEDVFSLDCFIVKKVKEPLKEYILHQEEHGMSLPSDFSENPTEWLLVLKKIEFSFDNYDSYDKKNKKKVQEGFELFGKYFMDLWDYYQSYPKQ